MSDLIYRQAAIDEIDEWIKAFRENGHKESAADACLIQDGIIQLPSVQQDYNKIIAEIKQCITETREHGKHHAKFVQDNGELYISGLEMALSIIEDVKNEKDNIS